MTNKRKAQINESSLRSRIDENSKAVRSWDSDKKVKYVKVSSNFRVANKAGVSREVR
ncbi:hypothetical protein K9N50_02550 [bacterium]|nr:hypothetical protein [bacterium]